MYKFLYVYVYCIINLFLVGVSIVFEIENMSCWLKEIEFDFYLIVVSKDFKVFGFFFSIIFFCYIFLILICESFFCFYECIIEMCVC